MEYTNDVIYFSMRIQKIHLIWNEKEKKAHTHRVREWERELQSFHEMRSAQQMDSMDL